MLVFLDLIFILLYVCRGENNGLPRFYRVRVAMFYVWLALAETQLPLLRMSNVLLGYPTRRMTREDFQCLLNMGQRLRYGKKWREVRPKSDNKERKSTLLFLECSTLALHLLLFFFRKTPFVRYRTWTAYALQEALLDLRLAMRIAQYEEFDWRSRDHASKCAYTMVCCCYPLRDINWVSGCGRLTKRDIKVLRKFGLRTRYGY